MEIFLNLLWLAIALGLLGLWRARWAAQLRERHYAGWRQWTAVICALIILFFMVSITDDLHSDLMVFEESSAGRRQVTGLDGAHHSPPPHPARAVFAILGSRDSLRVVFGHNAVAPGHQASNVEFAPGPNSGRAPPVIFL
jgi:hypothetical protein